ncbi:uncharacterized protein M421DRAFT_419935 [Didymella exigua CBS 183.55]|uniref:Uncharacterized protein n=1 Tax=Didymella exigua CBS 183.55 TaxID=1150837 RepID=A0A6A5RPS0_9PLEO|nr:uncharacterized protein M421DRAFT_419935 [Didymella exigua CBS 183.55]KAF1929403.1 hypothetical protein M421DRAFT_419935 [Didymella exigua CBS 183.55]
MKFQAFFLGEVVLQDTTKYTEAYFKAGINDYMQAANEETVRLISSTSSQTTSRGNIFGRWGRRVSITPTTDSSTMSVPVHLVASSMTIAALPGLRERCEDFKIQSNMICKRVARIADLEAENKKLYVQLSIEDDLGKDDVSDGKDCVHGIAL